MKIAIISKYYKNYNFGGLIQAYALVIKLEGMGFGAAQISFKPNDIRKMGLLNGLKAYARKTIRIALIFVKARRFKALNRKNKQFMLAIPHTTVCNSKNIAKLNAKYDVFITGSDQVWNPAFAYDEYFLSFVDKQKLRISYAASLGIQQCNPETATYLQSRIGNIEYISVREYEGKQLLNAILPDRTVAWVLDPTFLLSPEEWAELDNFRDLNISKPYALIYLMGNSTNNKQLAASIASHMKLETIIIPFTLSDYGRQENVLPDLGPKEFVSLIRHANVVLTDSFHATSLSIINHIQFYSFYRDMQNPQTTMRSRIDSLFKLCAIRPRWVSSMEDYNALPQWIDYGALETELEGYRAASVAFLQRAISGENIVHGIEL